MPYSFALHSLESELHLLEEAEGWMMSLGVNLSCRRIEIYRRHLEQILLAIDTKKTGSLLQSNTERALINSLYESSAIGSVN